MCFGSGDRPKERSHSNRRNVKRLEQHGYGIGQSVVGGHPITQERITLCQVVDLLGGQVIAMLGVSYDSL